MTTPGVKQQFALLSALGGKVDWGKFTTDGIQTIILGVESTGPEFHRFLANGAKSQIIVPEKHIVDCRHASMPKEWREANEKSEKKWTVEQHRNMGIQVYDPTSIRLFVHPKQQKGTIVGMKLRKELAEELVLPDAYLDFYLANTDLIPEEWKGKAVFFWGTIYSDPDGHCCVRYLYCIGERWYWDFSWLDHDWNALSPSAVLASSTEGLGTQC